jgi:hypothetical protein
LEGFGGGWHEAAAGRRSAIVLRRRYLDRLGDQEIDVGASEVVPAFVPDPDTQDLSL